MRIVANCREKKAQVNLWNVNRGLKDKRREEKKKREQKS